MTYRRDVFASDHYYHIYNRSVRNEPLFFNPGNYEYLLRLIKKYSGKYGASVISNCLMPNHYHFLLRQETDIPLSKFINVLFNVYVQAVNKQQERKGTLFEGRFHHVWVDREEYLVQLCRYIHRNPIKSKLVNRLEEWPYSNYLEWIRVRNGTIKDDTFIVQHFSTVESYKQFVNDTQDDARAFGNIRHYLWD